MLPQINPTKTNSWALLKAHFTDIKNAKLVGLFEQDPNRFAHFHKKEEGFLFDYSKNLVTDETFILFEKLLQECGMPQAVNALFGGEKINATENRAVMHAALRSPKGKPVFVDGIDISDKIHAVLEHMGQFAENVRTSKWRGYTGKPIKNIVNIGIGGSNLGPKMVTEALKPYQPKHIQSYFISNVDGAEITETLEQLDASETLFIISSKSFTTQETMANARTARQWFLGQADDENAIEKHFVAVSTNAKKVKEFGINNSNQFEFWDWVGGRYSVWSAIGLPVMLSVGKENFAAFLAGAHAADVHFKNNPLRENIPMLMACIGIWYRNFFQVNNHAILPYSHRLKSFPAFLQQADMESNGKHKNRLGKEVNYKTGPIIWGQAGTNGQHAFYQLLHQGTEQIPADFIAVAKPHHPHKNHQDALVANFIAQTEALMNGKTKEEARAELVEQGKTPSEIETLLPFKTFPGNKPTNSFLIDELTPYQLGKLIAFYEHKIFVQGVVWNVFSFDQWGVELGKVLANKILDGFEGHAPNTHHDKSTQGLIDAFLSWK